MAARVTSREILKQIQMQFEEGRTSDAAWRTLAKVIRIEQEAENHKNHIALLDKHASCAKDEVKGSGTFGGYN